MSLNKIRCSMKSIVTTLQARETKVDRLLAMTKARALRCPSDTQIKTDIIKRKMKELGIDGY